MSQLCCLSYLRKTMQQGENATLNAIKTSNLTLNDTMNGYRSLIPWMFDVSHSRSFKTPEMVEKEKEDAKWATAKVRIFYYPAADQPAIWLSSTFRWRRNLGWSMKRISSLGSETRQGDKDEEAVKANRKRLNHCKTICVAGTETFCQVQLNFIRVQSSPNEGPSSNQNLGKMHVPVNICLVVVFVLLWPTYFPE